MMEPSIEVIPFGWQKTRKIVEEVIAGLDRLGSGWRSGRKATRRS